jgi:hypothetical protein
MDEMYRALGREHEADLEREALKRSLARQTANGSGSPVLATAIGALLRRRGRKLAGARLSKDGRFPRYDAARSLRP